MSSSAAASSDVVPSSAAAPVEKRTWPQAEQQQSPAQSCFTNGIHSIFSFLTLGEFCASSRTCRSWSSAASTQPPLRIVQTDIDSQEQLAALTNSRRAWHIDQLHVTAFSPHDISSLLPLCSRLPHLTRLRLDFCQANLNEGEDAEETMVTLPRTLRELDVTLRCRNDNQWEMIDFLLSRVCCDGVPPLTALRFHLSSHSPGSPYMELRSQMPVESLRQLLVLQESLVEFALGFRYPPKFVVEGRPNSKKGQPPPTRWTQKHIDIFRQLTRLEKLDVFCGCWSDEELLMLCAEPAPAHLRILPLLAPPETAAGFDAVARLPLTEVDFQGRYFSPDVFYKRLTAGVSFLGRLSTLDRLTLQLPRWSHLAGDATIATLFADELIDTLAQCTRVTRLHLETAPLTDAHLGRLLPSLTKLREFDLSIGHPLPPGFAFEGLSFASHFASSLERFKIELSRSAPPLPIGELRHLLHALATNSQLHLHAVLPLVAASESDLELDALLADFRARGATATITSHANGVNLFTLLF